MACQTRFTTHEVVEETTLTVIKRNGTREEFCREKLLAEVTKAAEKRPIAQAALEKLVDGIRSELASSMVREVPFQVVGEMVLERLLDLDKIAYVRFASVYKEFKDPRDFLTELEHLFNLEAERSRRSTEERSKQ